MLRIFAGRLFAALTVSSAAVVLWPTGARTQQAGPAPSQTPVMAITPATDQTAASEELEKVIVTGYILPRVGDGPQPGLAGEGDHTIAHEMNEIRVNCLHPRSKAAQCAQAQDIF